MADTPMDFTEEERTAFLATDRELNGGHGGSAPVSEEPTPQPCSLSSCHAAAAAAYALGVSEGGAAVVCPVCQGTEHDLIQVAHAEGWVNGVRWASAEADAQASWREPVYILDITDHLRACASEPDRRSAIPRTEAPADYSGDVAEVGAMGILNKALTDMVKQAEERGVSEGRRQAAERPTDLGGGYHELEVAPGRRYWLDELGIRVMVDRRAPYAVLRWKLVAGPWEPTEQPEDGAR